MAAEAHRIIAEWSPPPVLTGMILLVVAVYVQGWRRIRRTRAEYFSGWRLTWFVVGMVCLWLAIASPIDGFADELLSAHMVQHFLLMSVVPPLVLLGAPAVPMLRGLPRPLVSRVGGPLLRLRWLRAAIHTATGPLFAWLCFNLVFLAWHIPGAYDAALRHEPVHDFEHVCFLVTSLLFWNLILHPWPGHARANGWIVLLLLLSADIVNTGLSAFLAFCGQPIYAFYAAGPNPFGVSPLSDQVTAGVLMWVLNSTVFLIPAMLLALRLAGSNSSARLRRAGAMRASLT